MARVLANAVTPNSYPELPEFTATLFERAVSFSSQFYQLQ
jgi:hypothetical protein